MRRFRIKFLKVRSIIYIVCSLVTLTTYGQKNYMLVNMGGAFPLGDFVKTGGLQNNGFATSGFNLLVEVAAYCKSWKLGVSGAIKFSSIGVDVDALQQDLLVYLF